MMPKISAYKRHDELMNFSQIKHGHRQTNGIALHVAEAGPGCKSILPSQMGKGGEPASSA